jgi:sporulation protein YlmC with PRC-barrel domain
MTRTRCLALEVLDRQLVDADEELCGKVDDILLAREDGSLWVAALLFGPAAWPDRLPRPLKQLASRLLRGEVTRIDWNDVAELSSAVRLKLRADQLRSHRVALPRLDGVGVRLSFLLQARVVSADGRKRGGVHEVEAVETEEERRRLRVSALLIGRSGLLRRLGLATRSAPAERIPWEEVAGWEEGLIRLRAPSSAGSAIG